MLDTKALAQSTALIFREYADSVIGPVLAENKALRERIAALEAVNLVELAAPTIRQFVADAVAALPAPQDGRDGADVDMGAVQRMIGDAVAALPAAKDGRDGEDGASVDPDAVKAMVADAVAALPMPKDGRDGADVDMGAVQRMIGDAVAALPAAKDGRDGEDGASVDPDAVKAMVADAVAALPAPQDGRDGADVDMDVVQRMIGDAVAALPAAKDGRDGEDGAGIADLVIDRTGALIATFTDGRMKDLGPIVGKDGRDGVDGKDGIPFGVDDIDMTLMEDSRTVRMAFAKGDTEYAFQIPFPVVIDRGVFAEGKSYDEGDGVTWGGSFWIAQRSTSAKPDSADSGWRLAVKRGRDGKDAR